MVRCRQLFSLRQLIRCGIGRFLKGAMNGTESKLFHHQWCLRYMCEVWFWRFEGYWIASNAKSLRPRRYSNWRFCITCSPPSELRGHTWGFLVVSLKDHCIVRLGVYGVSQWSSTFELTNCLVPLGVSQLSGSPQSPDSNLWHYEVEVCTSDHIPISLSTDAINWIDGRRELKTFVGWCSRCEGRYPRISG